MSKRALHIPPDVLALAQLSWPARLVLAEILDLYQVTGLVWANDQHFVNRLPGISLRTVQGAIKELVDAGRLVRETNQKAEHKRILVPADLPQNLHEAPADSADINTILNTKRNTTEKDAHFSANAEVSASKEIKVDSPIGQPAPAPIPAVGPTFEEFWQAYGRKVGRHKSELKWRAITPAERVAAMAALPTYVAKTPDIQFRKHPLSWLNGKHWQDEEQPATIGQPLAQPLPAGAPLSLTEDINEEFVAEQQMRLAAEAAERGQKFRTTYATPAAEAGPLAPTLTPAS